MDVLLLNFIQVFYPLLLAISTYILIELHARNFCSHRIQIALNTFVETFHGTFKDGLNGTTDYRVLPALFLITVMCSAILGSFATIFNGYIISYYDLVSLVLSSFIIAYARPCKTFLTNLSLSFHMMWVVTAIMTLRIYILNISSFFLVMLFAGIALVPHILMISWAIYKFLHNIRFKTRVASLLS